MDYELERLLKIQKPDLNKLYGDLPLDSDIVTLSKKIFKDFNIEDISHVCYKENVKHSNYSFNTVTYNQIAYEEKCIETVIHEIAHYFTDIVFGVTCEKHGACFTTTMKHLFKHYGLLNDADFNYANSKAAYGNVKFIDEALIKLQPLNEQETIDMLEKYSFEKKPSLTTKNVFVYIEGGMNHRLLINEETGKSVYTIRKLFKFEKTNFKIKSMTNEELTSFVLYSPIFSMDDRGEQVTNWLSYAGAPGFLEHTIVVNKEGEIEIRKNIIRKYCKDEVKSLKKQKIKENKLENKKYKNSTTLREYEEVIRILMDRVYI